MIAVLDYGIGNIGSIRNMLMKAGENDVEFVDRSKQLVKAEKIIWPVSSSIVSGEITRNEAIKEMEDDSVYYRRWL